VTRCWSQPSSNVRTLKALRPGRHALPDACPWHARSDGNQRGISVAHGHATLALTCGEAGQARPPRILCKQGVGGGGFRTIRHRSRPVTNMTTRG
jgi:hypothetical protein